MAHALLSPSAAHRWLLCPGAPALAKRFGERFVSVSSAEGSAGHAIAASVLDSEGKVSPYEWVGRTVDADGHSIVISEELVDAIDAYAQAILRTPVRFRAVEVPLAIDELTGEEGALGTADCVLLRDDGTLEVHDLKLGAGKPVYARDNPQLLTYLLAAHDLFSVTDTITGWRAVIHQPRVWDEPQTWDVSAEALESFRAKLRDAAAQARAAEEAAARVLDVDGPGVRPLDERLRAWAEGRLNPSAEACRWCPAKTRCPAIEAQVVEAFARAAEAEDLTAEVAADGPERLARLLDMAPVIEQWLDAVRTAAFEAAQRGDLPGYKIVEGRPGNRRFAEPERVEALLHEEGVPESVSHKRALLSPAQLEKALAKRRPEVWALVEPLIVRPPGKPTLVPALDARPALPRDCANEFPVID